MQLFYEFTDINGGVSKTPYESLNLALHVGDNPQDVEANRDILCKKYGIKHIAFMNQIHKTDVKIVTNSKSLPTSDGLITNQKNLALAVLVADCIPLLLYDSKNQVISAVHAGRAGVFGEIAKVAIEKMEKFFHSRVQDIVAYLGPCINVCCYEVSGEVLKEAKQLYPDFVQKNHLDIKGILMHQLNSLKVKVKDTNICTCCDKRYFSYRRDGVTGRSVGVIMLKDFDDS